MGIPSYFRCITKDYPHIIIKSQLENVDSLYLDFNGAIHPCCRKIVLEGYTTQRQLQFERRMVVEIIRYLENIVEYVNPKKLVYIAIDGSAPRAKMTQQRTRRFKKIKEGKIVNQITEQYGEGEEQQIKDSWDTNAITPGTLFMKKVTDGLKSFINSKKNPLLRNLKIILSDSNVAGEGEHKILEHIKANNSNQEDVGQVGNIIINGLDADLIMLSMASHINNIYLLREAEDFGRDYYNAGQRFLYLDIDSFKGCVMNEIVEKLGYRLNSLEKELELVDDYIFICFLLGNDFLPHMPSISIKQGGIDILLEAYCRIFDERRENIVNVETRKINHSLLLHLIGEIAKLENKYMINKLFKRRRLKPRTRNCETELDVQLEIHNSLPITDLTIEEYINPLEKGWRRRYYEKALFMRSSPYNIEKVCQNYCEGLLWVFNYYNYGCSSWSWFYRYLHPPTLKDLFYYLEKQDINKLKFKKGTPYKPFHQLLMVLPADSSHLLPRSYQKLMIESNSPLIEYYPIDFKLDTLYKRYFWECVPILPNISFIKIRDATRRAYLNKQDRERNRKGVEWIYDPSLE